MHKMIYFVSELLGEIPCGDILCVTFCLLVDKVGRFDRGRSWLSFADQSVALLVEFLFSQIILAFCSLMFKWMDL